MPSNHSVSTRLLSENMYLGKSGILVLPLFAKQATRTFLMGTLGIALLPISPAGSVIRKIFTICQTRMCFTCDDSKSDIWLNIEDGRYVPAPPMIYVPGLRQIHDRSYHHQAHSKGSSVPSSQDVVRLPLSLKMPASVPLSSISAAAQPHSTKSAPPTSTQPTPEQSTSEPTAPAIIDGAATEAKTTADNTLSQSPEVCSGSGPSEDRPEASQKRSHEDQVQEQPPISFPADGHAPGSADSAALSLSNNTSLRPSSSSSSLHSILKKPSISTSEDTGSESANRHDGRKHKKSVSFAEDTSVPTAKSPEASGSRPTTVTAVEECPTIARKLAERKSKSQGSGKASKDLGGGNGGADLRRSSSSSKHGQGLMSSASGMKKILKHTIAPSGGTAASAGECEGKHGVGGQQAGGDPLAQNLSSDEHDESCIDDEIPRRWL